MQACFASVPVFLGGPLMEEPKPFADKLLSAALVVAGLILLVPLMLLFAVGFYLAAIFQALRLLVTGRPAQQSEESDPLPRPHLWETRADASAPRPGDERSESPGS